MPIGRRRSADRPMGGAAPAGGPGDGVDNLLLEDGENLLLEDGGVLLLE